MTLHWCCPPSVYERRIQHCPTCERRRRFVGLIAVWYSPIWTCCGCGDSWDGEDGTRMQRPFARGWRAREVRRARENWVQGMSAAGVTEWLRQQIESEREVAA